MENPKFRLGSSNLVNTCVDLGKPPRANSYLASEQTYTYLSIRVKEVKQSLFVLLVKAMQEGKTVVGYGAPAKENTLLNYCGIRIDYTVDRSPDKLGLYLSGIHIPICHPDKIEESKPDYLLTLPWILKEKIMEQMSHIRSWGRQFVVGIPEVMVLP